MDSPTAALKADRSGGRRLRVRRRRRLQALPAQAGVVLGMVALLIAWYGVVEVPPAAPVLSRRDHTPCAISRAQLAGARHAGGRLAAQAQPGALICSALFTPLPRTLLPWPWSKFREIFIEIWVGPTFGRNSSKFGRPGAQERKGRTFEKLVRFASGLRIQDPRIHSH